MGSSMGLQGALEPTRISHTVLSKGQDRASWGAHLDPGFKVQVLQARRLKTVIQPLTQLATPRFMALLLVLQRLQPQACSPLICVHLLCKKHSKSLVSISLTCLMPH